jgi:hypothetical protein
MLLIAVGLWALPIIVAGVRNHPQIGPIIILDILLGWTGIGWIIALAMSLSKIEQR